MALVKSVKIPLRGSPGRPGTSSILYINSENTPCPDCCGTGTGSPLCNGCEAMCLWTNSDGIDYGDYFNTQLLPNNNYICDIAGFANGSIPDAICANFNGSYQLCPAASQPGVIIWSGGKVTPGDLNGVTVNLSLWGKNNFVGLPPDGFWEIFLAATCGSGPSLAGLMLVTYIIPIADYNGCGSVTLSYNADDGCPCGTIPSTVAVRAGTPEDGNCPCPCLLQCPSDFPTTLFLKYSNFVGSPIPNPTVAYTQADWPPISAPAGVFVDPRQGCIRWAKSGSNAVFSYYNAVFCSKVQQGSIPWLAGHRGEMSVMGKFVVPALGATFFINPTSFKLCDSFGTLFTGTVTGAFGGTCDLTVSTTFVP